MSCRNERVRAVWALRQLACEGHFWQAARRGNAKGDGGCTALDVAVEAICEVQWQLKAIKNGGKTGPHIPVASVGSFCLQNSLSCVGAYATLKDGVAY